MKILVGLWCVFYGAGMLVAQPTWSGQVASIIYRECGSCHVQGGIAPFTLTSYDDAYWMSAAIKHAVEDREMPPFPADVTYRGYAHERVLSSDEIATISAWVEGGSPEGDPAQAPEPPTPRQGPVIATADVVATMPEYTSTAASRDVYRCFTIPVGNQQEQVLQHVEVVPGNLGIVHHVLVFVDTSDVSEQLDAQDPGPGYSGFGSVGSPTAELIAAYVPGMEPIRYPDGFGLLLPPRSRIILQVHYPAGSAGQKDQTQFRAALSRHPSPRLVQIAAVLNPTNMTDGPLVIPANTVRTFHQRYTVPFPASLLAVIPHMHLLGRSTKIWAVEPSGDTIPLISIPKWDFHWQMVYTFKTLQRLRPGTRIESEVTYDNTTANPENPSDPPITVRWGESTTDEMILTYFTYVPYQPGDENIRLDAPVTSVHDGASLPELRLWPSPASTYTMLGGWPAEASRLAIDVVDATGAVVHAVLRDVGQGARDLPLDLHGLPPGAYQVRVAAGGWHATAPLIVVR